MRSQCSRFVGWWELDHSVLVARFGEKAVAGRRALVGAAPQRLQRARLGEEAILGNRVLRGATRGATKYITAFKVAFFGEKEVFGRILCWWEPSCIVSVARFGEEALLVHGSRELEVRLLLHLSQSVILLQLWLAVFFGCGADPNLAKRQQFPCAPSPTTSLLNVESGGPGDRICCALYFEVCTHVHSAAI